MWRVWGRSEAYTVLWWGKMREGDRLGDPGIDWEDNIKMDIREVGCLGMDWIELTQDRNKWWALAIAVTNLRVP